MLHAKELPNSNHNNNNNSSNGSIETVYESIKVKPTCNSSHCGFSACAAARAFATVGGASGQCGQVLFVLTAHTLLLR
ncbi:unnamed protein product [Ceratitis capitata]|uniref:(Mediterranean fruit fly) hypothetical protein n=1 Tax=Ceratitis capitata TaxID=7213 RepID=A0A811VBQ1_CERCA|nr:unnamed protein product [Ceratitis capitata]